MTNAIGRDLERFREIVKGKIRKDMRKYISHGEMIGRRGKDTISIPVPKMDLPHFRHGKNGSGGVGQGDGEIGDPIGKGEGESDGTGKGGSEEGSHIVEVEMKLDELAKMLGESLELPFIEPKGDNQLQTKSSNRVTHRHAGLNQRVVFKPTYKNALIRSLSSGVPLEDLPTKAYPQKPDKVNRFFKDEPNPEANAAAVHIMDVSGSVTDEMKEIVRTEAFWIDTWLEHAYKGLIQKYIIFDAKAKEVDKETFYNTRESGGTRISSGLKEFKKMIERDFPPEDWNIYGFLYGDGDNWVEDNKEAAELINELAEMVNLFGYTQTNGDYGRGDFIKIIEGLLNRENIRAHEVNKKDDIPDALKALLGKSRVASKI